LWQVLLGAPVWRHAVWRLLSHPEVASGALAVAPGNAAPFEAYLQAIPCAQAAARTALRGRDAPSDGAQRARAPARRRAPRGGA
jgi:hypothetical protein